MKIILSFIVLSLLVMLITGCSKSEDQNDPPQNGTVMDIDGNVYHTVSIGTQVWMVENLRTTKYRDGTSIPNVIGNSSWSALTTGAYCWYDNDVTTNKATYGALYNGYAVYDNRNIAPQGWHVATDVEWATLETFLGGPFLAGGKLKESGTTHWLTPNQNANNESGFSGLPAGNRSPGDGNFYTLGHSGWWWMHFSNSNFFTPSSKCLSYIHGNLSTGGGFQTLPGAGLSVRCVKD